MPNKEEKGMTFEEAEKILNELMEEGISEEELVGAMYMMYSEDKLTLDELRNLISILGYEFTDEFAALPESEKKKPENALKDKEEPKKKRSRRKKILEE